MERDRGDINGNDIIAGFQEIESVMEGMAILMNDVWHSALIDSGGVSSRTLMNKFKSSKVKVRMVVVMYG